MNKLAIHVGRHLVQKLLSAHTNTNRTDCTIRTTKVPTCILQAPKSFPSTYCTDVNDEYRYIGRDGKYDVYKNAIVIIQRFEFGAKYVRF